jgi:ribosomal protein L12E/L44/L45/RPP1/RPP2
MRIHVATAAALLVAAGVSLDADRIRMRSGKVVEGMFIGGDSKNVRILLDDGSVSEVPLANAVAVEFSARKPPAPAAPAPAKPPAAAPKPAASAAKAAPAPRPAVVVPAGTPVNVRLAQDIDVDVSQAGHRYKAIVDDPVMVGGAIIIPRGAAAALQAVNVQQSGQMKGSDKITLKLNTLTFGGVVYEVTSEYVESKGQGEGKKTARKVGGGAGLGAIVGGIAGGGSGAAIGAAVGGATGAAVASGGEEHLKLPSETRLQFQLTHAVTIR